MGLWYKVKCVKLSKIKNYWFIFNSALKKQDSLTALCLNFIICSMYWLTVFLWCYMMKLSNIENCWCIFKSVLKKEDSLTETNSNVCPSAFISSFVVCIYVQCFFDVMSSFKYFLCLWHKSNLKISTRVNTKDQKFIDRTFHVKNRVIPCQIIQYFWMLTPLPLRFCSLFHYL